MNPINSISLSALPALGAPLDAGIFAGVITQKDGTHVAVVLLPERGTWLDWDQATEWAKKQSGVLPTPAIGTLLYANVKAFLMQGWHWTSQEDDSSRAWRCYFDNGYQRNGPKVYECGAVAVRLIPLTA